MGWGGGGAGGGGGGGGGGGLLIFACSASPKIKFTKYLVLNICRANSTVRGF